MRRVSQKIKVMAPNLVTHGLSPVRDTAGWTSHGPVRQWQPSCVPVRYLGVSDAD
jgi:hypothetical protein